MRQAIISLCAMGLLAMGVIGCQHENHDQAMSMSSMACCGDSCKKMDKCCSMDSAGNASCSMGGSCCMKK